MNIWMRRKGFTLVEIMIVVAIIGLLAAIAIPNFANARKTAGMNACKANLRQVVGAMVAYSADNPDKHAAAWADLTPNYIKSEPKCAGAGTYTFDSTNDSITCSLSANGHNI